METFEKPAPLNRERNGNGVAATSGGAGEGDYMLFGRDAIQVVTTIVYVVAFSVIVAKSYSSRRSFLVFIPLIINVLLTIVFYLFLFMADDYPISFGDLSAMLRLETGLTILIYAVYMPLGRGRA